MANQFIFEYDSQKAPLTKSVAPVPSICIDMMLQRIFIDRFRDHVNNKLKSRFTSQNKKLQKKKLKKLKAKEQAQEKEREQKLLEEKKAAEPVPEIKVNNSRAIEMLIGKIAEDPHPKVTQTDFNQIKKKKKGIEKPSTPNQVEPLKIDQNNYFQMFPHAMSTSSNQEGTIKTQSTNEDQQKRRDANQIQNAMSNHEILNILEYKDGNSYVNKKEW